LGDTNEIYPAVTLAIAEVQGDEQTVEFVEDSRCLPGGPARVDEAGDYYIEGGAYWGFFYAYGDRPSGSRVKSGAAEVDLATCSTTKRLGSYVSEPWIHVEGSKYFARAWNPEQAFPEDQDTFWGNAALRPLLIDTQANTTAPFPDLEGKFGIDGVTREVGRRELLPGQRNQRCRRRQHRRRGAAPRGRHPEVSPRRLLARTRTPALSGTRQSAQQALDAGRAQLISFGRPFISNPDLVQRFAGRAPLATPQVDQLYTPGPEGYVDDPTL